VFTAQNFSNGWGPTADPIDPLLLWLDPPGGGLLVSYNAGLGWAPVPGFPAPQSTLDTVLVLHTDPATILAADGVVGWKSADVGATWRAIPQRVLPVAYETQTPSFVYARNLDGALFVSADAGETWTPRALRPPGTLFPVPGTRTLYALGRDDLSISPDRGRH